MFKRQLVPQCGESLEMFGVSKCNSARSEAGEKSLHGPWSVSDGCDEDVAAGGEKSCVGCVLAAALAIL